jgi:hypothetical protein
MRLNILQPGIMLRYLLLPLLCLYFSFSFAQTGGYSTYKFLNLQPSARITALGGNLISVKDHDLNNAYQNPSLLNSEMHNTVVFNTANYFADINYGYAAYARSYKNVGTFSGGIQYINYGDFNQTDEYGNTLGTFSAKEQVVHVSYGRNYQSFSYGATLKGIFSSMESYNSAAIATDIAGTFSDTDANFTAGFVLKNIGTQLQTYSGEREKLPFEAQFGISKKLKHAPFRFSIILHDLQKFDLTYVDPQEQEKNIDLATGQPIKKEFSLADKLARHVIVGTEIIFSKHFNIRVGYNHQKRKEMAIEGKASTVGFSWGVGVRIKKISFSYGSARYSLAGSTNMFSFAVRPSDFIGKK